MLMPRTPRIGTFDDCIEIYNIEHYDDQYGGKPRFGELKGEVWANISVNKNAFTGTEQVNYKNTNHITYKILIRDPLDYEILYTDAIKYNGKLLVLENVSPKDQRGFYYDIRAYEVSPSSFVMVTDQTGLYVIDSGDQVFVIDSGAGIYAEEEINA